MKNGNLQEIDSQVSRFLQKASKKNDPLEAFRKTESFTQFVDKIEAGIMKQAKWLSKNLDQIHFLQDETVTDSQFDAKMGNWLGNEMPTIASYVSSEKIYAYLFNAFTDSVKASYSRHNIALVKSADGFVDFELTNPNYIAALKNQANYLLNASSLDETTRKRMITLIRDARLSMVDLNDLAEMIESEFEGISATRAFTIANTEANQAMSSAQQAFLVENGFKTKQWVGAGPNTCPYCQQNEDDGAIGLQETFSTGDLHPPGHPGCECYQDAGEEIDLNSIQLWDGSGGEVVKALQEDVSEVRQEIKKSEEAIMVEVESKIQKSADETSGRIGELHESLADKIKGVQDYMKDHADEVRKSLAENGQPINKTVIQKMDLPKELIDILGILSTIVSQPPVVSLADYKPHDEEEGPVDYYGFMHPSGAWYIVAGEDNKQRYAAGDSDYSKAWKEREKLNYKTIDEVYSA